MKNRLSIAIFGILLSQPLIAAAQTPTTYSGLVYFIVDIINVLIPLLFAVVFLYLVWKIIDSWILNAGDEVKRGEGKKYAFASVIVFVLMISAWGIVRLIKESLFP